MHTHLPLKSTNSGQGEGERTQAGCCPPFGRGIPCLAPARIAEPLVVGEVSSALDIAHALFAAGELAPWGSVLARSQTAGRGQLRRHWHSPEGNVYAALRLPPVPPFVGSEAAPALGALAAVALEGLFHRQCTATAIRLKWPNDLIWLYSGGPRKIGGILLEERNGCLVAGMGINVCHAPPAELLRKGHAMTASCLLDTLRVQDLDAQASPAALAEVLWRQLVRAMYFWYTKELHAPSRWLALAESRLLWKNQPVFLSEGQEEVRGTLLGLLPCGGIRLMVEGTVMEFFSGSLGATA